MIPDHMDEDKFLMTSSIITWRCLKQLIKLGMDHSGDCWLQARNDDDDDNELVLVLW